MYRFGSGTWITCIVLALTLLASACSSGSAAGGPTRAELDEALAETSSAQRLADEAKQESALLQEDLVEAKATAEAALAAQSQADASLAEVQADLVEVEADLDLAQTRLLEVEGELVETRAELDRAPAVSADSAEPVSGVPGAVSEEMSISGVGSAVIGLTPDQAASKFWLVTSATSGEFEIDVLNSAGEGTGFPVLTMSSGAAPYSGTVVVDKSDAGFIQFLGDVEWSIEFLEASQLPVWSLDAPLTGNGDAVYAVEPTPSSPIVVDWRCTGCESYVSVRTYGSADLRNSDFPIGDYDVLQASAILPTGTQILEIDASNRRNEPIDWTLTPT